MKKTRYRANATEINKAPGHIRYLWVIQFKASGYRAATPTVAMTYQTLDRVDPNYVEVLRVVDLSKDKVLTLAPERLEELKSAWRENYFNPEWDIV
ncbi:MAG: hypothetical protein HF312_17295 [Ignavibacteria bacterium]|nr:hypothetical protein [Ignavibacteria bacterium]